jgi:branched-chain amino acid aminotransferase
MIYHVDGELVPADDATVDVRDRGFRHGDAAFEPVRAYGGTLFSWDRHTERLRTTCDRIGIDHGLSDADLRDRVAATLDANDLEDAVVRLSVTRGVDDGALTPPADPDPTVVVTVRPCPRGGVDGTPPWDGPATLQTVKTRRVSTRAIPAAGRTHSRLDGVLARRERHGTDEALVRDGDGHVVGGAACNVFFVDDDALHTPGIDGPVVAGVPRSVVLDAATDEGIPVHEGTYRPSDVRGAEEAFLTGLTQEVRPVGAVDGVEVGGGPVTRLLAGRYDRTVERSCYDGAGRSDGRTGGG